MGPCIISCWIIIANHSVGNPNMPLFERALMYSGFVRHSIEGLMSALFDFNRPDAVCPPNEVFCLLTKPRYILKLMGYENMDYTYSVLCLVGFYLVFNVVAYINFKWRLDSLNFLEKNRYYQYFKKIIWKYCYLKLC